MDLFKRSLVCLIIFAGSRAEAAPTAEELGVVMAPPGPANRPRHAQGQTTARSGTEPVVEAPSTAAVHISSPPSAPANCPPEDAFFLPTGLSFPALLPDAIYSYALSAPVMATIEDDVKFRNKVVLPRGTHLMGNASAIHTLDRVNINWSLVVLPEGCEFPVSAIALSADDGSSGIKGKLETHEGSIAAQIALKSMLSAANVAASAASTVAPMEGAVASGFSNEANQTLDQSISKTKSLESIYIHERTAIRVFVLHRFVRSPERG